MKLVLLLLLTMGPLSVFANTVSPQVSDSVSKEYLGGEVSVLDDVEQSAGGWASCDSGTVNCSSGRSIGCNASSSVDYSSCSQRTGSVGWVYCRTINAQGYITSSYYDACP